MNLQAVKMIEMCGIVAQDRKGRCQDTEYLSVCIYIILRSYTPEYRFFERTTSNLPSYHLNFELTTLKTR